jgi:uncharacterized protein YecT (DUF1311 family)
VRARAPRRWRPLVAGAGAVALAALLVIAGRGRGDDRPARAGSPVLDSLRRESTPVSGAPTPAPAAVSPARRGQTREAAGEVHFRRKQTAPPTSRADGAARPAPGAAAGTLASRDRRCASPTSNDQRACLLAQVEREDVPLNRTYGALIGAVRREGGEAAVQALRVQQRAWLVERDSTCRARHPAGAGALWGVARAPCFAELSARREAELAGRLRAAGRR